MHSYVVLFINQYNKTKQNKMMDAEEFECYLINTLDNEDLTDKEKIILIRQYI